MARNPFRVTDNKSLRINLAAAIFPFQTGLQGPSVIVGQLDQDHTAIVRTGEPSHDVGIPQANYMHNVMPTSQGFQAIAYDQTITPITDGPNAFDTIFNLSYVSPNVARVLFAPAQGKNYIYDQTVGSWVSVSPIAVGTISATQLVTVAYVKGTSYICYAGYGIFKYDQTTKLMVSVTLTGITASGVQSICSAYGYLLLLDSNNNVYWSSLTDPTVFTPSLITGAGSGTVAPAEGRALFILPISGGFIVYCERNTVGATYTGNIDYPFTYLAIPNAGGAFTPEEVAVNSNTSIHYAWTTAGMQQITLTGASFVFPELVEFLSKLIFEDFNETTLVFNTIYLSQELYIKTAYIADRWLVFSYGITYGVYTHALVFDTLLSRWGKLKTTHIKCFEYTTPNLFGAVTYGMLGNFTYGDLSNTTYGALSSSIAANETPAKNLAFCDSNGGIKVVNFDLAGTAANGVLMVGKFQFIRNRNIIHQTSDLMNVSIGTNFKAYLIPSFDSHTLETPILISEGANRIYEAPQIITCGKRVTARTISYLYMGSFNLTATILRFTLGAKR